MLSKLSKVSNQNFQNPEIVYSSNYGKVMKVFDSGDQKFIHLKYLHDFKLSNQLKFFLEDQILEKIEGFSEKSRFIKRLGIFTENQVNFNWVMMFEAGEANLKEIVRFSEIKFDENEVFFIFESLLDDLIVLQENSIVHRNIKPENIIIFQDSDDNIIFKLTNFDVGCIIDSKENLNNAEISTRDLIGYSKSYAAPEILQISEQKYSSETYNPFSSDVYSLGKTILQLLGENPESKKLFPIIQKMIIDDPMSRITFSETKRLISQLKDEIGNFDLNEFKRKLQLMIESKMKNESNLTIDELSERIYKNLNGFFEMFRYPDGERFALEFNKKITANRNPNVLKYNILIFNEFYKMFSSVKLYEKAKVFCENAFNMSAEAYGKENLNMAPAFDNLGDFYMNQIIDYQLAKNCLIMSLNLRLKFLGEKHEKTCISYKKLGNFYEKVEQNLDLAEEYYLKSIFDELSEECLETYMDLFMFYQEKMDFEKAELYQQKIEDLQAKIFGNYYPAISMVFMNFAIYWKFINKDESKSEACANKGLKILKNVFGDDFSFVEDADSFLCLSIYFEKIAEDVIKTNEYLQKSYVLRLKNYGAKHNDSVNMLSNMAFFNHISKRDFDQAELLYRKLVKIAVESHGEAHPSSVEAIHNLSMFLINIRCLYPPAEKMLRTILKVRIEKLGSKHNSTAMIYETLADLNLAMGKREQVEEYYKKSLEIRTEIYGEKNRITLGIMHTYGNFLKSLHNFEKSEEILEKCLNLRLELLGDHNETANNYRDLAELKALFNVEKAEEYHYESIRIIKKLFGEKNEFIPTYYSSLAIFFYMYKKDLKQAEDLFLKALNIRMEVSGKFSSETAEIYNDLANFYWVGKKNLKKTIEMFKTCLNILVKVVGIENERTKSVYETLYSFYSLSLLFRFKK